MPVRSIQPLTPETFTRHHSPAQERISPITSGSSLATTSAERRRGLMQVGRFRGDDKAALAGQQALVDPAAGPLPIADFAPILVFCDDFDRHGLALEHPVDGVARAGAGADIDLVRPQGGEARNGQARPFALSSHRLVGAACAPPPIKDSASSPSSRQSNKGGAKREGRSNSHCHLYTLNLHVDRQVLEKPRFSVAFAIGARCWTSARGIGNRTRPSRASRSRSHMPSSSKKKPLVIVTRKLPDAIETRLMELFDTRLNADDKPMTSAELVEAVKTADVLVPTVTDRIDSRVLSQAGPRLKLIASFGTGVDHIDLDTARQRGITVTNTPGVLTEDTADMTMALVLAMPRRMGEGERVVRDGQVDRLEPDRDAGRPAAGQAHGHRRHGPHRPGAGAPRARLRPRRSTITTASASMPRSSASSRRPTGRASTRCWRAWTSCRSTARTRRRPTICCRRGGSS